MENTCEKCKEKFEAMWKTQKLCKDCFKASKPLVMETKEETKANTSDGIKRSVALKAAVDLFVLTDTNLTSENIKRLQQLTDHFTHYLIAGEWKHLVVEEVVR
jgi:ATP-dependent protease Clp ATPase subunit